MPTHAPSLLDEAICLLQKGKFSEAGEAFENCKSDDLTPSEKIKLFACWSQTLIRTGKTDEAEEKIRNAESELLLIGSQLDFAGLYTTVADSLLLLNDYFGAMAYYEIGSRIEPSNGYIYLQWGKVLDKIKRQDEATKKFDEALKRFEASYIQDPTCGSKPESFFCNWGDSLCALGKYEKANQKYLEALKYNKSSERAYLGQANVDEAQNENQKAKEKYEKVIYLNPLNPEAHYKLGTIYEKMKHPIEAQNFYFKAIELDPLFANRGKRHTCIHNDNPAGMDDLNRKPFAEVIARCICQTWYEADERARTVVKNKEGFVDASESNAFLVGIHGPWGSGKTSVLNFIRDILRNGNIEPEWKETWVTIYFNAWSYRHSTLSWWLMLNTLFRESLTQVKGIRKLKLWFTWYWWRFAVDKLPVIIALAALVLAFSIVFLWHGFEVFTKTKGENGLENFDRLISVLGGVAAIAASIYAATRSLLLGSATAVENYVKQKHDPQQPVIHLFERMIKCIRKPVVFLIDNLDRCEADFVVNFLEGTQTLFRKPNVAYVITSDKEWLCTCFEKAYEEFSVKISYPGKPMGYLFLDKLFQISVNLPLLSENLKHRYWSDLIDKENTVAEILQMEKANRKAREIMSSDMSDEGKISAIRDIEKSNPYAAEELRAQIAGKIISPGKTQEYGHVLKPYFSFIEPNPRSMKQLINLFGLKQSTMLLEGRDRYIDMEPLTLSVLLEMRWPLLAKAIARNPLLLSHIRNKTQPDFSLPENIKTLLNDTEVIAVVNGIKKGLKAEHASLFTGK